MVKEEPRIQELNINDDPSIEETDYDDDDESIYEKGKTEVYLGLVDANIKETDEISVEDTFIGGDPVWLHPDSEPSEELLQCKKCNDPMKLLMQAFAPLDKDQIENIADHNKSLNLGTTKFISENDDRVLYIFACTKCSRQEGSIRCIRGVKNNANSVESELVKEEVKDFSIGKKLFDFSSSSDSANPFGSPATSSSNPFGGSADSANPFGSPFVSSTEPESTKTPATENKPTVKTLRKLHDKEQDKKFSGFPGYFVYVEAESFKNKTPDHLKIPENIRIDENAVENEEEFLESVKKSNSGKSGNSGSVDPRTEKLSKILDDDTFQKFQEVVGYNPGQVLRYDLGGEPLLYCEVKSSSNRRVKNFSETIGAPEYNPSSSRIFEMQLMPKMIIDLEDSISIKDGMEWGTIMVFTDLENYVPKYDEHGVGYVEELCMVQWEPRD